MRPFDLFFQLNAKIDWRTNWHTFVYISMMFLGFPDDIHEEKPSFLQFKKKRITDQPTDRQTDGRTDPLIEMRGRI